MIKGKKFNFYTIVLILINICFFYLICNAIKTSFVMISANRSLWVDEAMLAVSFSQRTLIEFFTKGEFEYLQSAPLGWLVITKIISQIFGYQEYILRSVSFFSFIAIISLLVFIQGYFYKSKFPFAVAAIFSSMSISLRYSNMFKQYEFEALIALVVFICYMFYEREKVGYKMLSFLWIILILCSQSACFVVGGLILSEFLFSIFKRDKEKIKNIFVVGTVILGSFLAYYFLFVSKMTSVKSMQAFWSFRFFPLFPKSKEDIDKVWFLTQGVIFKEFSYTLETLFIFISGLLYFIYKKEKEFIGICLCFLLMLIASNFEFYPLDGRLLLFLYPLILLCCVVFIEKIIKETLAEKIFVSLFLLFILFNNNNSKYFQNKENIYMKGEETRFLINYLRNNIKKDEKVYFYKDAVPGYRYQKRRNKLRLGKLIRKDNVILGSLYFMGNVDYNKEIEKILQHNKIYIALSHQIFSVRFQNLFEALWQKGYLELVKSEHDTHLYYFSQNKDDCKLNYKLKYLGKTQGRYVDKVKIRIQNTGKSFLNDPYNKIYLINKVDNTIIPIEKLIAPNESIDVSVPIVKNQKPLFTLQKQFGRICKEKEFDFKKRFK